MWRDTLARQLDESCAFIMSAATMIAVSTIICIQLQIYIHCRRSARRFH